MASPPYFKTRLHKKGQITMPAEVRRILNVSEGDDIIFRINEEGQVVVERGRLIPPEQAWFWTKHWQQMERDVQTDIDSGRTARFDNIDEMLTWLEEDDAAD